MTYGTIVADPPWRFDNRRGKGSQEHGRLWRYRTLSLSEICSLGPQVLDLAASDSHLYLWVPTSLLGHGLRVLAAWGYDYKTAIYWEKVSSAGLPDRRGLGFYYRNAVEPCLLGTRGSALTERRDRTNVVRAPRTRHSAKPEEFYRLVEEQSPAPRLELFARGGRPGWESWGDQASGGVVLLTTDPAILETWRDVVASALGDGGPVQLSILYEKASLSPKVRAAIRSGHKWKAQIRRTLQKHFHPEGRAVWRAA